MMSNDNNNNNNQNGNKMKEESILAFNYVPQQDRLWSELSPSITMGCRTLVEVAEVEAVQSYNINNRMGEEQKQQQQEQQDHSNKNSNINNKKNNNQTSTTDEDADDNNYCNIPLSWPNALHEFNQEFRYAIEYRKHEMWMNEQQQQQQHHQSRIGSGRNQQPQPPLLQPGVLPSSGFVHGPTMVANFRDVQENDTNGYIQTFTALVRLERQEILRRYELYTQYHQSIHVSNLLLSNSNNNNNNTKPLNNYSNTNNNKNYRDDYSSSQLLFLNAYIPGIADSKPLPQRGDWIILRPLCYVSMPIMNTNNGSVPLLHNPLTQQQEQLIVGWTPSCHVVDIRCTITNVTRSNGGAKDCITATWLEPEHDEILKKTYYGTNHHQHEPPLFQLRIIPNKKEYERCIVALVWLQTLLTAHSSERILPLLFPTHAPVLTRTSTPPPYPSIPSSYYNNINNDEINDDNNPEHLNTQQASFVNIVLKRTHQPSYEEIRPPIILTGPAGTGKTKTLLYSITQVLLLLSSTKQQSSLEENSNSNKNNSNRCHGILVCTPSHTAANVITQRLATTLKPNELFRLLDSDRNIATIPISILSYCHQAKDADRFDIPPINVLRQYRVIVSTCTDAYLLYKIGFTNQQLRQQRTRLRDSVQKECNKLNVKLTFDNESIDGPHFTHFFMDEAAQATEPESMIPLSVVLDPESTSRKVEIGLVGDPRQLSPMIYSKHAADAGLHHSWMERLLHRPVHGFQISNNNGVIANCSKIQGTGEGDTNDSARSSSRSWDVLGPELIQIDDWLRYSMEQDGQEQLAVFLTLNYRGHPSFLMIPSCLFYSDRLQRAGYTTDEIQEQQQEQDQYEMPGSISTENYWCQKLRILESLAVPVTLTPRQQQHHQQGHQTQSLADAVGKSYQTQINSSEKRTNGCANGVNNDQIAHHQELFTQYKQWDWPIHFRGVIGKDTNSTVQSTFSTESWCNNEEAKVVVEIIVELTSSGKISTNKIGVMAPFRGQVVLIRKLLRAKNLGGVDVGTVEDYQSAERDVVVLSLTRSSASFLVHDEGHRIGLFGRNQAKRCNVALTRAKKLLVVVGNPDVMLHDFLWRQFLWFCFRNVFWYGESGKKLAYFSWSKEMQVVRSYDILQKEAGNSSLSSSPCSQQQNGINDNMKNCSSSFVDQDTNTVVISSLERSLRIS